ncbi:MAG TPA: hypothetical protein VIM65_00385 [Cyclobacteriaceae bacterium]
MDISQILRQIDDLPIQEQLEVYAHLASKLKKREQVLSSLEKIRGKGLGLWNKDAQEYVNRLRENDRF